MTKKEEAGVPCIHDVPKLLTPRSLTLNLIESSSLTQLAQLDENAGDLETKAGGCERIGSVLFLSLDSMAVTLDGSLVPML
jgi:hypothetical protein